MISFALFGAGRIGAMHAKNIFENGKSKLVYVYDPNKIFSKKIAGKFNCKIADNPDEIFNDKFCTFWCWAYRCNACKKYF